MTLFYFELGTRDIISLKFEIQKTNQNQNIRFQENVVCYITAIVFSPQCINQYFKAAFLFKINTLLVLCKESQAIVGFVCVLE